MKTSELKLETESLICAAHKKALRTNGIKNGIDHQDIHVPAMQALQKKVESVTHIVSSCSVLAGNQYRKRHNNLGKKYSGSCARNFRLNMKTNGSRNNQSQSCK